MGGASGASAYAAKGPHWALRSLRRMGGEPGVRGRDIRPSTPERVGEKLSGWREALTRGPNPGRRDRAEQLARPTRVDASLGEAGWALATWAAGGWSVWPP
jgi:hypothetical protein